jgi:hypothetical protein
MALTLGPFTFNGLTVVNLPCDTMPGVCKPSSIEIDPQEAVAVNTSPFTFQTQTYDWRASSWHGQISFAPMDRYSYDAWTAFILSCRGQSNAFQFGDPKAVLPKGPATGTPVVSGAGQAGYSLVTRGWTPNVISILMAGDYIQVGYRLYKLTAPANSDGSGNATLSVWPNLRDQPADGVTVQTRNCRGLFRLANNNGNKGSTNIGLYGLTGFAVSEAI